MKTFTAQEFAAEIRVHFPHFKGGRFDDVFAAKTGAKGNQPADDTRKGSDLLHDYCQIGALMTDETRCLLHLGKLESALRDKTKLKSGLGGTIPNLTKAEDGKAKSLKGLKLPKTTVNARKDEHIKAVVDEFKRWRATPDGQGYSRKFNGALQEVLQAQEDRFGFNGAQFEPGLDGQPNEVRKGSTPVLTGFVAPADFTKHLLEQKRHWKDPGARGTHGEFTHRLQWWIVMQEKQMGANAKYPIRGDLAKRFAQLVKYPFHPDGVDDQKSRNMWDFLFDCFTNAAPKSSDSYRTPDNLHSAVMAGKGGNISLLQAIIVARHNKREIMRVGIGSKALDEYEAWKVASGKYTQLRDDNNAVVKFIVMQP
jgi:Family of unknown function (DUF5636)